jgi:diguanylate cyclase (GGDEF)-like protein
LKEKKTLFFKVAISLIASSLVLFASHSSLFNRLEFFASDVFFRFRGAIEVRQPIVIIEITDQDIEKIGRWPWDRSWHAAMTKVLADMGAKSVYFDVIFSEASDENNDALFEEAMRSTKIVYLPYVFPRRPYNMNDTLFPIERFASNAKDMGAMNIYPDNDGVIRNIQLIFTGDSGTYPHVALKIAVDYMGLEMGEIKDNGVTLTRGEEEILTIPLQKNHTLLINWTGKWTQSFEHYSFIDVLASYQDQLDGKPSEISRHNFENAICLVGITGFGLFDIKPIPLEPEYPGIGIVANAISTMLDHDFIRILPLWCNILLLYLLALLPSFLVFGGNPFRETLIVIAIGLTYSVVAFLLFLRGIKVDLFFPIIGLLVSYISVETYNFVRTTVENKDLFSMSITDGLTGLCNIRYFKTLLETEVRMARSGMSSGFVVVLSDIDHFKNFNDTYGHQVGDLVLKEVANSMKGSVRATDIVARYGGEEIIILLKNASLERGLEVTEKIRSTLEESKFSDEKNSYSVTVSFGVASYLPEDGVDSIIKRSDEGLYKAKESGRNCTCTVQE